MRTPTDRPELTLAQQRDHFRGRCALALQTCSKITNNLANAIRISPMDGCVDVGAIDACREQIAKLTQYLNAAQESALDVRALEAGALEAGASPLAELFAETSVAPFDRESSKANLDALERRARITEPMRRVAARALSEQALVHRCIRGRCPRCREIADAVLDAALNAETRP